MEHKYKGRVLTSGQPVCGIAVSDGRSVVKTAADGSFSLPGWERARFIFITVPSGFETPDPDSFAQEIRGEDAEYVFEMRKSADGYSDGHCFLHFSDTEIGINGTGGWTGYVKELVKREKPAFIVHTGDICRRTGLIAHKACMNSHNMGCRVIYTLGNHDYAAQNADGSPSAYGEHLFESVYGPLWYSFDIGCIHYVVSPIQGGEAAGGYEKGDLWKWLQNDLAAASPDKKIILFNHNCPGQEDAYTVTYEDKALDLAQYPLLAWVFGHYHSDYINRNGGVFNICTARPDSGGIDHTPSGVRRITIGRDGGLTSKLFYYEEKPETDIHSLWKTVLESRGMFGSPLADDGCVYIPTVDDGYPKKCGVYCLSAADGAIKWKTPTGNSVKNDLVLHNGTLFALDCGGTLYFLDPADGHIKKTAKVTFRYPRMSETGLAAAGGVVYAGSAGRVEAFDAESGERLWEYGPSGGEPSPTRLVICGKLLICGSQWSRLFALDRATGALIWENKGSKLRFRSSVPLILKDNRLLVASNDTVFAVNTLTGRTVAGLSVPGANFNVSSRPLLRGKGAYFATADRGIVLLDVTPLLTAEADGEEATDFPAVTPLAACRTDPAIVFTSPYTGKGSCTVEGDIYALNGNICFAASDGCLYLLDADTLSPVKKLSFASPFFNSPAFVPDGRAPSGTDAVVFCLGGRAYSVRL